MNKGVPCKPSGASLGLNDKDDLIPLAHSSVSAEKKRELEKALKVRRKIERLQEQRELNKELDEWDYD